MRFFSNLPFEWYVGLRYLRSGKRSGRNRFISFISMISMAGIALGVAALIIVMSVMNGFQKEVRDRMLSVLPHIEIQDVYGALPNWKETAETVKQNKDVAGTAPYVMGQAMLTREDFMRGVIVRGVDPALEGNVSDVGRQFKYGSITSLQPDTFNIAIGKELARLLRVGVGDKVTVVIPQGQVTPAGILPRLKQFTVSGIFEAGHFEFDTTLAFISIDDAMRIFQADAPTGLRVKLHNMQEAPAVAKDLSLLLLDQEVVVRDWSKQNKNWFAAVQTEKKMMFIILMLIIAVAAFNLVSTLVMTVTEKQADIAILRTLGATPRSIMKIFMVQGALAGILGTLIGVSFGILVSLNIDVIVPFIERLFGFQFLPKNIYLISTLPSDLQWMDVLKIGISSIVLSFLATLYPSWSAAKVNPAEALRYE
ncbi:MAG: lipoprotein-releasing ABC transporter permease subunit [Oxalobacter sp.]|nr:lipoprotein-releasing ABC transporter permease subunit [Oxalobacter sp.]